MEDVTILTLNHYITHVKGLSTDATLGLILLCWHNRCPYETSYSFVLL